MKREIKGFLAALADVIRHPMPRDLEEPPSSIDCSGVTRPPIDFGYDERVKIQNAFVGIVRKDGKTS